jgi:hypothetical protein
MMRLGIAVLGQLVFAMTVVAACQDVPVAQGPIDNDPVPLPADMQRLLAGTWGGTLMAADATFPQISAGGAVELSRRALREEMAGNDVPAPEAPWPAALVRRVLIEFSRPTDPLRRPVSVWVAAYRWKFDCHDGDGPGPCDTISFYFIDDRTGRLVTSYGAS